MLSEPWSAPALLSLGLVFGLKHALDVDHLVAVATIASERRTVFQSSLVGAVWGLGHTAALLVVGGAVLVGRFRISDSVAALMEAGVAVMLVYLGVRGLWRLARAERVHVHVHEHDGHVHVHPHLHHESAAHEHDSHRRPFAVGIFHGLAGSAALMLVIVASTPSPWIGFAYILSFGLGSIGGMVAMSALVSVPAVLTAQRFEGMNAIVRGLAAALSIAVGLGLGYEIWSAAPPVS